MKEKFLKLIKRIKEINLENLIVNYVPLTKYVFEFRDYLFSYEMHEKTVFLNNMPSWYAFYELNFFMRALRVLLGLWLILSRNLIPIFFDVYLNIDLDNTILFPFFNLLILLFFIVTFLIKFILRCIFIKKLLRNSPFSLKNCLFWGVKQFCGTLFITGGLGLGVNIVDSTLERQGYVPPGQYLTDSMGYYMHGHVTQKIGTDDLSHLELIEGKNMMSKFIREQEIKSLEKRKELIEIYNAQQRGEQVKLASKAARQSEKNNF